MKKILIALLMMVGWAGQAQTFEFDCGANAPTFSNYELTYAGYVYISGAYTYQANVDINVDNPDNEDFEVRVLIWNGSTLVNEDVLNSNSYTEHIIDGSADEVDLNNITLARVNTLFDNITLFDFEIEIRDTDGDNEWTTIEKSVDLVIPPPSLSDINFRYSHTTSGYPHFDLNFNVVNFNGDFELRVNHNRDNNGTIYPYTLGTISGNKTSVSKQNFTFPNLQNVNYKIGKWTLVIIDKSSNKDYDDFHVTYSDKHSTSFGSANGNALTHIDEIEIRGSGSGDDWDDDDEQHYDSHEWLDFRLPGAGDRSNAVLQRNHDGEWEDVNTEFNADGTGGRFRLAPVFDRETQFRVKLGDEITNGPTVIYPKITNTNIQFSSLSGRGTLTVSDLSGSFRVRFVAENDDLKLTTSWKTISSNGESTTNWIDFQDELDIDNNSEINAYNFNYSLEFDFNNNDSVEQTIDL